MTTLELYRKHKKGEIGRDRFLYEVRRDNNLPWITNITSYDDAVKILKNKGIIREAQFEPQNIATDPLVDRVNPYALKREVDKLLSKETELTNDSYKQALNKAAKKLTTPQAVKKAMFANAETVEKADAKLQMQPVKKANHKDKANEMKKAKGQQAPKATAAPTGENKKTKKPKGVEIMKDKGVEGSEKVLREAALAELQSYLKKKLAENITHYEFHEGMEVETAEGPGVIKAIQGGTLEIELKNGKVIDEQMNTVKARMEKKKEDAEMPKQEESKVNEEKYSEGNIVKIEAPNDFDGLIGIVEEVYPQNVRVRFSQEDIEDIGAIYNTVDFSKGDVIKLAEDEEEYEDNYGKSWDGGEDYEDDDQVYGEDDLAEARDINDPALVRARAMQTPAPISREKAEKIRALLAAKQKLLAQRLELDPETDAEQQANPETEPSGGPVADEYGEKLNFIDNEIKDKIRRINLALAKLTGKSLEEVELGETATGAIITTDTGVEVGTAKNPTDATTSAKNIKRRLPSAGRLTVTNIATGQKTQV